MRGSNSHGRSQSPLHYHYANPHRVCVLGVCPQRSYIIACPTGFVNAFFEKTSIFSPKFSVFQNSSLLRQSFSVIRCRWISLTAGGTFIFWAIPHNSKCRYGERGAAAAKPKAQIILCAAKVSAASGGCSEPKQGQRSQSARGFCPEARCGYRNPTLSSILATQMPCRTPSRSEALRSATAACGGSWRGDPPERCLSRKAGIMRCCPWADTACPTRCTP